VQFFGSIGRGLRAAKTRLTGSKKGWWKEVMKRERK